MSKCLGNYFSPDSPTVNESVSMNEKSQEDSDVTGKTSIYF